MGWSAVTGEGWQIFSRMYLIDLDHSFLIPIFISIFKWFRLSFISTLQPTLFNLQGFSSFSTLEDLTHAVSEYFRTCSIRLGIHRFLYRCV